MSSSEASEASRTAFEGGREGEDATWVWSFESDDGERGDDEEDDAAFVADESLASCFSSGSFMIV